MAEISLREVADLVGGKLTSGDPANTISGVENLVRARAKHAAFYIEGRLKSRFEACKAGVLLVKPGTPKPERVGALIEVADPDEAFTTLYQHLLPRPITREPGIHPTAVVDPTATVSESAHIGPYVVIGPGARIGDGAVIHAHCVIMDGSVVGDRCILYPHCVLRERTTIGANCLLQPGVVLGADGFGYKVKDGALHMVPQLGTVELGDDVHIGANTCIDRARFGKTSVGRGTKIDNLVQIGHNVTIGSTCGIAGMTGIAGSVTIGDFVHVGGGAVIANEVEVGSGAKLLGRCGIFEDVEPNQELYWAPADGKKETFRLFALFKRLPDMSKTVQRLERDVAALRASVAQDSAES